MKHRGRLGLVALFGLGLLAAGCGDTGDPDEKNAIALPSGVKYFDQRVGDGAAVKDDDAVSVRYVVRAKGESTPLEDTMDPGKPPARFVVGSGTWLSGADAGLVGMKVGGKRKLFLPPASTPPGQSPVVDVIPPGVEAVVEVELQRIDRVQIEDVEVGKGEAAKKGDTVEVLYRGTLKSTGAEFDSSEKHGNKPFEFRIGAGMVIKGWDLGVAGMKPGGERKLTIPAPLAYGSSGSPPTIPPDSDLVFEVKMLRVVETGK